MKIITDLKIMITKKVNSVHFILSYILCCKLSYTHAHVQVIQFLLRKLISYKRKFLTFSGIQKEPLPQNNAQV